MKPLFFAFALALACATAAVAADKGGSSDEAYLNETFGVHANLPLTLTPSDLAGLHDIISDPVTRGYPGIRDARVQSFLYELYQRQCRAWSQANVAPECPPVAATLQPGKDVADRQCNTCHLFGTAETPAFFSMARKGTIDEQSLSAALAGGHRMSPISLTGEQIHQLVLYIRGLK